MEAARANLDHAPIQELTEAAGLEVVPDDYVDEAEVATGGIASRLSESTQGIQLKMIDKAPVLGEFMEKQLACACKAGCVSCVTPTFGAALFAWFKKHTSVQFGRRSSHLSGDEHQHG